MIHEPYAIDKRRKIIIPGDKNETLSFIADHWIKSANIAIEKKGSFYVALSGGSTPKKLFQMLSSEDYRNQVDWSKVYLFWSDERSVAADHPDSNYHMALVDGGLKQLPILPEHIFRMEAEADCEKNALAYEITIKRMVKDSSFDLIMLGMGDDGHTASLFPYTKALHEKEKLVVANYVPQKKCWRLSFTFTLINQAKEICIYVLGAEKATMLERVLTSPFNEEELPSQGVGSAHHPALWIADREAGHHLLAHIL